MAKRGLVEHARQLLAGQVVLAQLLHQRGQVCSHLAAIQRNQLFGSPVAHGGKAADVRQWLQSKLNIAGRGAVQECGFVCKLAFAHLPQGTKVANRRRIG